MAEAPEMYKSKNETCTYILNHNAPHRGFPATAKAGRAVSVQQDFLILRFFASFCKGIRV